MFENDQHHKGKEERESEVDEKQAKRNATRHKSKQMFCSLKRTAKIPPNGLIKWQDLHFSSPLQQGLGQEEEKCLKEQARRQARNAEI
jgi:hypothetical protein